MTAKQVQCGLVVITAALLSAAHLAAGEYRIAAFALACGATWLLLERKARRRLSSFIFVGLIGVAVLAVLNQPNSLGHLTVPIMILGVSTDLAAWDLSRFLARASAVPPRDGRARLERRHLRQLSVTLGAGFVAIVPALVVQIPLGFGILVLIVILLMIVLRRLVLDLRPG